jgi:hypothetical protein
VKVSASACACMRVCVHLAGLKVFFSPEKVLVAPESFLIVLESNLSTSQILVHGAHVHLPRFATPTCTTEEP